MSIRRRIVLILSGIILFIVIGPALILVARGFRYDFDSGLLVRTGILTIKTEPRGARATLDGKELNPTPLVKRFLDPGEYTLEIFKEGYYPWKKRVAIFEHQVTYIPHTGPKLTLLKKQHQESVVSGQIKDFMMRGDETFYLKKNQNHYEIFRRTSSVSELVSTTTSDLISPEILDVRPDTQEIIMKQGTQLHYVRGKEKLRFSK